jgi:glycosyltransferase involved in cell wall biosynthesis
MCEKSRPKTVAREHISTENTRVAVVIPALNEESSIDRVIHAIPRPLVAEIIVVDNGSTDGTAAVARESGAIVLFESRKGYGYACLAGIDYAVNNGAEIIVFFDGDFSDYPEELPMLVQPIIEQGYDMVIGSRIIGARENGAMLPQALFGNWLACTLIRLTDLGPFRAIRIDALQKMAMSDPTFGWTVEMQIIAARFQLKSTEVH